MDRFFCLIGLLVVAMNSAVISGCEVSEKAIVTESYLCNRTEIIWTKEKCMLFFQCDRQLQRLVPANCTRNVSSILKKCCNGHARNDNGECQDVDECKLEPKLCTDVCVNTPGSFKCECLHGNILSADGSTCLDINECSNSSKHNCSHSCINTLGSYSCSCPIPLVLGHDGRTCVNASTTSGTSFPTTTVITQSTDSTATDASIVVTVVHSYRVAEKTSLFDTHLFGIWLAAGFAILITVALVGFALIYRRRRNRWPFIRMDGTVFFRKSFTSPDSVQDMINTSGKSSKVFDDATPDIYGLDTSNARIFRRNPYVKPSPFASVSNSNKCSVAFSSCSAATGASSVTLMCNNVIAGTDSNPSNASARISISTTSEPRRDGTTSSHIYCELRESGLPYSSTPTALLNVADANRPTSPCYASLPITDVPLMLTPVTSPSPVTSPAKKNEAAKTTNDNIYNDVPE